MTDTTDSTAPTSAAPASTAARYTSRKLLFCLAVVAAATWLLHQHLIGEASWVSVAATCVTAYVLGNLGQKGIDAIAPALTAALAVFKKTP